MILLNDNVGLLEQNLRRFAKADIDPDPKIFKEILDDIIEIKDYQWIIFCKKNQADLKKLIRKVMGLISRYPLDITAQTWPLIVRGRRAF